MTGQQDSGVPHEGPGAVLWHEEQSAAQPQVSRGTVSAIMAEIQEQLETVARPDWTVAEVRSVGIYILTLVDELLETLGEA